MTQHGQPANPSASEPDLGVSSVSYFIDVTLLLSGSRPTGMV